jgi:2-(3-amino-3-carboxypropyl)histidine synthase
MEEVIEKLRAINAKRVFVQFPEGLKLRIQEIAKQLEKNGFETYLCLDSTWGACDIREDEAKRLKCDAILHIAHSDFGVKADIPVIYYDYFLNGNPQPILEKEFSKLENYQKIGLVTSLQFIPATKKVKEFLESKKKKVFMSKSPLEKYEGQMLGCRAGAGKAMESKVDAFLCVSAGKFYGLGLAMETDKPLLNLDLEKCEIYSINDIKAKVQKIVAWNKQVFKEAKRVGFLISWKRGQMFGNPSALKKKLEKEGKEVYLFAMDEISQQKLEGLKLDIFINFACPRISTDDQDKYKIPMLNYYDIHNR